MQWTRLAQPELNALVNVPTDRDHGRLTVWSTQHPCAMCAAAIAFVGVGSVRFIADDPSDDASPAAILATRGAAPYDALGEPFWWTVSKALFLSTSAVQSGSEAAHLRRNRDRAPAMVELALTLAAGDGRGMAARDGVPFIEALDPHDELLRACVRAVPSNRRRSR